MPDIHCDSYYEKSKQPNTVGENVENTETCAQLAGVHNDMTRWQTIWQFPPN